MAVIRSNVQWREKHSILDIHKGTVLQEDVCCLGEGVANYECTKAIIMIITIITIIIFFLSP